VPDDVGGRPFQNGWEPDDDRGGADEDFASVVFGEDFVKAATIHEPTAVERLLAAAEARAEAEAAKARAGGLIGEDDLYEEFLRRAADREGLGGGYGHSYGHLDAQAFGGPDGGESGPYGLHGGVLRPYRGRARWHRPIAWLLAMAMGIGMVALAFAAVYRGASSSRQDQVPSPVTTGVDSAPGVVGSPAPSASADHSAPRASAMPRRR
jgi:hypothetical protein